MGLVLIKKPSLSWWWWFVFSLIGFHFVSNFFSSNVKISWSDKCSVRIAVSLLNDLFCFLFQKKNILFQFVELYTGNTSSSPTAKQPKCWLPYLSFALPLCVYFGWSFFFFFFIQSWTAMNLSLSILSPHRLYSSYFATKQTKLKKKLAKIVMNLMGGGKKYFFFCFWSSSMTGPSEGKKISDTAAVCRQVCPSVCGCL